MNNQLQHHINEFLLCNLFENSTDIILITDRQNKIIELNVEASLYFGCHKHNALNQDYKTFCTKYHQVPVFDDPSKSDGVNIYDEKHHIEWCAKISFDTQQNPRFTLITGKRALIDIKAQINQLTLEKKQIETDNQNISQYLQDIISVVPGSIYWKNKEGIYLGCNDYMVQTAGLSSKSDIIGKSDFELWPNQASQLRETDHHVMTIGHAIRLEEEVLLPNGKKRLFIVGKMPLKDLDGNINGIIGNSLEITDLKETQAALEAANQAKTEFIANMGHDIRTPLTGVIGLSQALESELQHAKHKQFAGIIRDSGNQLLSLLNGILDVISSDNINEQDIQSESFNLPECIQSIVLLTRSSIEKKGIKLLINIDKNIPTYIVSDRTKIHRILLNLLGNSIKFTETGQIELSVHLLKKEESTNNVSIQFRIQDTGIGIPVAQQPKVFDRFFRGNPSYQGIYNGNGIGLHIAQSFVTLLGGTIQLTSQEHIGTTFYFDLTLKIGEQRNESCLLAKAKLPQPSLPRDPIDNDKQKPHVLLVEDNPIALMVIENLMHHAHLRYISATNAESALMLAKIHDFNLIITDLGLPGMSGIELTQHIREWETSHHKKPVPIIGLSAHAREEALVECLPSGMNDGFSKPITRELVQTLKNTYIVTQDENTRINELSSLSTAIENMGTDLPDTEDKLFQLKQFQIFDVTLALRAMNDNVILLPEILRDFLQKELPESLAILKEAYNLHDWERIEKRVHYMKSTLNFIGTPRMKFACQYLERYRKAGHHILLDKLYQQLIDVSQLTESAINHWLQDI